MEHKFVLKMEDYDNRLTMLEQIVLGKDGPEFRFEKLEKKQEELDVN